MKELLIGVILLATSVSSGKQDQTWQSSSSHEVEKRDSQASAEQRDLLKSPSYANNYFKYSDVDIPVVKPPQFNGRRNVDPRRRPPVQTLQRYLQLLPVENGQDFPGRNPKKGWAQERIMSRRPKPIEQMNIGQRLAKWFFSPDREEDVVESGSSPKEVVSRGGSNQRPPNYESYPPFWNDDPSKLSQVKGHYRSKQPPTKPPIPHYKHAKKDCNPCNSVPWIPIFKNTGAHAVVPQVDVHHDTTGYSSSHQAVALLPAPVVEHISDTTISNSFGLPVGNIPTGHGLLAPVNHLASRPSPYGTPIGAAQILQPIPFPHLSAIPLAPVHESEQFIKPETADLVPPIAPEKTVSNVIFHISEQNTGDVQHVNHNHLDKGESSAASQQSTTVVSGDQSSDSSSLIDTHITPKFHSYNHHSPHYSEKFQSNGNLDIVKSVPLAEYTSSIEYPLHVIQSGPYIDIASNTNVNATSSEPTTYEKESQTGDQKISDILLGIKGTESKKTADSDASGSIISELQDSGKLSNNINNFKEVETSTVDVVSTTSDLDDTTAVRQIEGEAEIPSDPPRMPQEPVMQPFQNSYLLENGQLVLKDIGASSPVVPYNFNKYYLDPNILTPPPAPPATTQLLPLFDVAHFNAPTHPPSPYLNPPPKYNVQAPKAPKDVQQVLTNPIATWLLPSEPSPQWTLANARLPGIATVVNGGLLPPVPPQPLNPVNTKTKKIQIIIPYTTINNQEYDQSSMGTAHQEVQNKIENDTNLPMPERANTWLPISMTPPTPTQNQPRKVPPQYQTFEAFKNSNRNEGQHSENQFVTANFSNWNIDNKYFNDVKSILATNIKELLKDEVESPKPEQNIRLQKNIDNWTALEYSNHKVTGKKEPKEVISHAQAVTTIPGTSISHLLLPSKKIPSNYFTTTALPNYDEPSTTSFPKSSVSVNSKPFTPAYTTVSMYSTVSRNGVFSTTPKPEISSSEAERRNVFKIDINKLEQIKKQQIRNSQLNNFANQRNSLSGYDLAKIKVSQWGKLNENLIVPEDVSKKTSAYTSKMETTTRSSFFFDSKLSTAGSSDNVYVVTPVSDWKPSTEGRDESRRTTRHIATTEKTFSTLKVQDLRTDRKPAENHSRPTIPTRTEKPNVTKKPWGTSAPTTVPTVTSTVLLKTNFSTSFYSAKNLNKSKFNKIINQNTSTPLFRLQNDTSYRSKVSKFNKPKPIDKFFATTKLIPKGSTTTTTSSPASTTTTTTSGVSAIASTTTTTTAAPGSAEKNSDVDKTSINDIFPFRNGGELPLEMLQTNLNPTQVEFRSDGKRKTLIKQVKFNKKAVERKPSSKPDKVPETTTESQDEVTTEYFPETSTTFASSLETNLQVDVVMPIEKSKKEAVKKKDSIVEVKKNFASSKTKSNSQSSTSTTTTTTSTTTTTTTAKPASSNETDSILDPEQTVVTDEERDEINNLKESRSIRKSIFEGIEMKQPKGVTMKIGTSKDPSSSGLKPESIQETIKLLEEFLRDASEDASSTEKTEIRSNKNFKDHDKLLGGLESLKPMLNQTVVADEAAGGGSANKTNVKENLKNIEKKLLTKFNKKQDKDKYVYNFPEYLVDNVNLNKDEYGLVEGAMVELRKQANKTLEI